MNISPLEIYLITRLDEIKGIAFFVCAFSWAAIFFIAFITFLDGFEKDTEKKAKSLIRNIIPFAIMSSLLMLVIPTMRQAVAMFTIPQVINSRIVQEDVPQAVRDLWKKVIKEESK